MRNSKILWSILALMLALLVAVVLFKAWPVLFPTATIKAAVDKSCDLRKAPCRSVLTAGQGITFSIEPRHIPLVEPLQLTVRLQGLTAQQVEVDFAGVDMYMGYNRVELKQVATDRYTGVGRIPVCVRDAMEWEAKVMVRTPQGLAVAPYRFISINPDQKGK